MVNFSKLSGILNNLVNFTKFSEIHHIGWNSPKIPIKTIGISSVFSPGRKDADFNEIITFSRFQHVSWFLHFFTKKLEIGGKVHFSSPFPPKAGNAALALSFDR